MSGSHNKPSSGEFAAADNGAAAGLEETLHQCLPDSSLAVALVVTRGKGDDYREGSVKVSHYPIVAVVIVAAVAGLWAAVRYTRRVDAQLTQAVPAEKLTLRFFRN